MKLIAFFKEKLYQNYCKICLKNKGFSIISDDCWGGRVYTDVGVSYTSPTVNLFLYSYLLCKVDSRFAKLYRSGYSFYYFFKV